MSIWRFKNNIRGKCWIFIYAIEARIMCYNINVSTQKKSVLTSKSLWLCQ